MNLSSNLHQARNATKFTVDQEVRHYDDPSVYHPLLSNRDRKARFTKHSERRTKFRERYAR